MGLFGKLFGSKKDENKNLDNNRLIRLLDKWGREENGHSFQAVFHEVLEGNSFFLVPAEKSTDEKQGEWKSLEEGLDLKLTSATEMEEVKTILVFSDEESLRKWAKEEIHYNALKTQDVFEICRQREIDRVIINSGQPNMFILERQKEQEESEEEEQEQPSRVRIGIPANPLHLNTIRKIRENATENPNIEQVYQFVQEDVDASPENRFFLMIGLVLAENTDSLRLEAVNTIKQALQGQKKPDLPLGIMILDDDWLTRMRNISNQPFYTKE